jgi:hypothetical protein
MGLSCGWKAGEKFYKSEEVIVAKKIPGQAAGLTGEQIIWVAVLLHGDSDGINSGELVSTFASSETQAREQMQKFFQDDEESGDYTVLATIKPLEEIIQFAVVGNQSAIWLPDDKRNRIH